MRFFTEPCQRAFALGLTVLLAPPSGLAQIASEPELPEHAECAWFTPKGRGVLPGRGPGGGNPGLGSIGRLTIQVANLLPRDYAAVQSGVPVSADSLSNIDKYLFAAMQEKGVTPAEPATDYEFIRRVTLDLTGRIPDPQRVLSFVNDSNPDKRLNLVNELLAKPEWVDKWTMFYGDLFKNNSRNTQIQRFPPGVAAFYKYIRDSLQANKPYDQMARELISVQGTDSYVLGQINFLAGGFVGGGPVQDVFDGQTVLASTVFLGVSHINCLLCHNGRGHLDSLSLWGKSTTRASAWKLSSFMSHTFLNRTPVIQGQPNPYYWSLQDNTRYTVDYQLNTTTGNRPSRSGSTPTEKVAPMYLFGDGTQKPDPGEDYRVALSRFMTSDFQFARAAVNYIWQQFFGKGIVDPPDQFDPMRLDPDNPPPDPWTLQPSNARLLNALAQDFIDSKYDLKALMREIATSRAYQLSSRYAGAWDPNWENLFARKLVRRLWGEEIHDAIAQSSGLLPSYAMDRNYPGVGTIQLAMKLPEPLSTPDGLRGTVAAFLDSFLRGDRDEEDRRGDGSITQALSLMNDSFVMQRIRSTGNTNLLLARNINLSDDNLINTLFLTVLSRYPSDSERIAAQAQLRSGNRNQAAEDLLWSLYNKVDFLYNY